MAVTPDFTSNELTEDESIAVQQLIELFSAVTDFIEENIMDGRYQALAFNSLEVAAMWTNKAIAKDGLV
jgi:hypothetical protein